MREGPGLLSVCLFLRVAPHSWVQALDTELKTSKWSLNASLGFLFFLMGVLGSGLGGVLLGLLSLVG